MRELRGLPTAMAEKILYRPNVAAILENDEGKIFIAERRDVVGA